MRRAHATTRSDATDSATRQVFKLLCSCPNFHTNHREECVGSRLAGAVSVIFAGLSGRERRNAKTPTRTVVACERKTEAEDCCIFCTSLARGCPLGRRRCRGCRVRIASVSWTTPLAVSTCRGVTCACWSGANNQWLRFSKGRACAWSRRATLGATRSCSRVVPPGLCLAARSARYQ
jgi:hypothetical protein